ncbi:hypothetical protein [Stenomitos frigidus]|uniref:hypothetical protein n=1 Tax=Stenomitos frigidus TaxID=1886765 RepID=UPI0015E79D1C|nr:hypothetical protein [Stenomitos frigidus]
METSHSQTSACRRCRYYEPEGRRGGHCNQLNVNVQGAWSACTLAIPLFSPAWENFEDIMLWQQKTLAAIEESAFVEPLEPALCFDGTSEGSHISYTEGDRLSSKQSFSNTASTRMVQPRSTESKQTMGIKALWM